MTTRRLLPLAFVAAISLTSCEKEDVAAPAEAALLEKRWQLTRIDDFPIAASSYARANQSSLEFVGLGTCTVGLGPCNNFSGRYSLGSNGQQLHISPQISTRATCPVQALETQYLAHLEHTTHYAISGDELRLYDATAAAPRLVFRRAER